MTSPISFVKDSFLQTNSSFSSSQKVSDHSQILLSLFRGTVSMFKEASDRQGNHSRLLVLKNGPFFGIVSHPNAEITYIPPNEIINFCTNSPISLKNLKNLQKSQIDLVYVPEGKKLIISPHLRAAGKDDQIVQVATRSLNPKPPASWVPPPFEETPGRFNHLPYAKDNLIRTSHD